MSDDEQGATSEDFAAYWSERIAALKSEVESTLAQLDQCTDEETRCDIYRQLCVPMNQWSERESSAFFEKFPEAAPSAPTYLRRVFDEAQFPLGPIAIKPDRTDFGGWVLWFKL